MIIDIEEEFGAKEQGKIYQVMFFMLKVLQLFL